MGIRLGLLACCVAVALAGASDGAAQSQLNYRRACVQELQRGDPFQGVSTTDWGAQGAIAQGCADVARDERTGGVGVARARFYAGRAYRLAGDTNEAIRHLENAVSAGPDFSGFSRELRAARLELSAAYRAAGRLEEAEARLAQAPRDDPAAALQRAQISLARFGPDGRAAAFNELSAWFTREDTLLSDRNSPYPLTQADIAAGRAWLFRIGLELGQGSLRADAEDSAERIANAQTAIQFFGPVADAIRAACPDARAPCSTPGIADTPAIGSSIAPRAAPNERELASAFYELGAARLRAAGLQDGPGLSEAGDPRGLDCLGGAYLPQSQAQIDQAKVAFGAIERRYPAYAADAHWGIGCAILADLRRARDANQRNAWLSEAVGHLVAGIDNRPENLVTLARARAMQGALDDARRYYLSAAGLLTDDGPPDLRARKAALRSRVYVELARSYLAEGDPSLLDEATSYLRLATNAPGDSADARLMLGQIYMEINDYASALPHLEAARDLGDGDAGKAPARYLLSRRLTLLEQQRLAPLARSGSPRGGDDAVDYATRAFQADQSNLAYRHQACLARIVFGYTADQHYCAADRGRDGADYAQALLYEGMFQFKRGGNQSGGARLDSWSIARRVFQSGIENARADAEVEGVNLRELLHYGERYVLLCAGLGHGDPETASEAVRQFFRRAGMPNCNRSYR